MGEVTENPLSSSANIIRLVHMVDSPDSFVIPLQKSLLCDAVVTIRRKSQNVVDVSHEETFPKQVVYRNGDFPDGTCPH